jgi:hypothetical protein
VLVEGKRTEAGPTTSTTWMPTRHPMLRNIDAAWDIAADRDVVGLFAVHGDSGGPSVPDVWKQFARDTLSPDGVDGSLPHRNASDRQASPTPSLELQRGKRS